MFVVARSNKIAKCTKTFLKFGRPKKILSKFSKMSAQLILILIFLKIVACLGEKPEIQHLMVPDKLFEGKKFHLTCQLNSGKQPIFTWYHSDELIGPSDRIAILSGDESSQLTIKEIGLADSGPYVCKAENAFGSDSRRVELRPNGKL